MRKSKIFICIASLVMLVALFLSGCKEVEPAIKIHELGFKYDREVVNLEALKEDCMEKLIIFSGEVHGFRENFSVKKELIMFIKENGGFKYLLTELSPADAYIINRYLETGDKSIIDEMYGNLRGTFAWTRESYEFLEWLYSYNKGLNESEKIICVGSDIVHQNKTAVSVLKDVLQKREIAASIENLVEELNELKSDEDGYREKLRIISRGLCDAIEDDIDGYREHYDEDFLDIYTIAKAINSGIDSYDNRGESFEIFTKYRDKAMYEIFGIQFENLAAGKFYGQWGNAHTYLENPTETQWFGAYLNDDRRFKGKIASIQLMYDNSTQMNKSNRGKYKNIKVDTFDQDQELFKAEMCEVNTLYKLDVEDSIFNEKLAFNFNKYIEAKSGVTTDYIQYFIRIDGATPTNPLH